MYSASLIHEFVPELQALLLGHAALLDLVCNDRRDLVEQLRLALVERADEDGAAPDELGLFYTT